MTPMTRTFVAGGMHPVYHKVLFIHEFVMGFEVTGCMNRMLALYLGTAMVHTKY